MRLRTLMKYYFMISKRAILIFYSFYIVGALIGSIGSTLSSGVVFGVSSTTSEGIRTVWSSSIMAFSVFMLITSFVISQKDNRFLITRSVSRKEIFLCFVMFLVPLSAIMSVLQMISIYLDGFVRYLLGAKFRGLKLDIQSMQAPNMNNIFVFFLTSFSLIFCFGAICYLVGSLLARWKVATIGTLGILFICFITFLAIPEFFIKLRDILKFMFVDENTGLMIVLKQMAIAAVALALAFPVMRRITAAKQS